jgi:hypothetical protein
VATTDEEPRDYIWVLGIGFAVENRMRRMPAILKNMTFARIVLLILEHNPAERDHQRYGNSQGPQEPKVSSAKRENQIGHEEWIDQSGDENRQIFECSILEWTSA